MPKALKILLHTVYGHPGVLPLVVLCQLLLGDLQDLAPDSGQVLARVAQADPVHQGEARAKGNFVPRVAYIRKTETMRNWKEFLNVLAQ